MPIKLPKSFPRRKSSGNILDGDLDRPAGSSFRVLERPDSGTSNSFEQSPTGNSPRFSHGRPSSSQRPYRSSTDLAHAVQDDHRGSNGTTMSESTGRGTMTSSAGYSMHSTVPSSHHADNDESFPPFSKKSSETDIRPTTSATTDERTSKFGRGARAFSFGRKNKQPAPSPHDPMPIPTPPYLQDTDTGRARAETASSYASTAVPPRVDPEPSLDVGDLGSDFSSMFDNFGKRTSRTLEGLISPALLRQIQVSPDADDSSTPLYPAKVYSAGRDAHNSPSYSADQLRDITSPPFSANSRDSHDALLSPPNRGTPTSANGSPYTFQGIPEDSRLLHRAMSFDQEDDRLANDLTPKKHANGYSALTQESDGKRRYQLEDRGPAATKATASPTHSYTTPSGSSISSSRPGTGSNVIASGMSSTSSSSRNIPSYNTTPKATSTRETLANSSPYNSSPVGPPSFAKPLTQSRTMPILPKKAITPAEFERLRKAQESVAQEDSEEEDSEEESEEEQEPDPDDSERDKHQVRLRERQDAMLSVYRQQMQKTTGEQPTNLPSVPNRTSRPSLGAPSLSAPSMSGGISNMNRNSSTPDLNRTSDEDEDDDVPLGILQAHGFPSKNRPPLRVENGAAPPILVRSSTAPSVSGETVATNNGGNNRTSVLPAFARHLPQDPFNSSGIHSTNVRESLNFHAQPSMNNGPPPQSMNPGGLVGVIAGEERARAMRRGSPNNISANMSTNNLSLPNNMPMPMMNGQPYPGMPMNMNMMSMGPPQQQQQQDQQTQTQIMNFMAAQTQMLQQMMLAMQNGQQMPQQGPNMNMNMNMMMPPQIQLPGMENMGMSPQQQQQQQQNLPPHLQQQQQQQQNKRPITMSHAPTLATQMSMATQSSHQQQQGHQQPRAMSMMSPTGWSSDLSPGYVPSIAPSERSNVGQPTRYRPVSLIHAATSPDISNPALLQPVSGNANANASTDGKRRSSMIRVVEKVKGATTGRLSRSHTSDDDDEDDAGWKDMIQQREKAKRGWRRKTGNNNALLSPSSHGSRGSSPLSGPIPEESITDADMRSILAASENSHGDGKVELEFHPDYPQGFA